MLDFSVDARAKVNLTLRVLGRRPDGFHALDSIVAFANVGDRVVLSLGKPSNVSVTGPFGAAIVGTNLALTALQLLSKQRPILRSGSILIDKHLPVAAGLGGGSADTAAVLRLVKQANPDVETDWLAIASQLGSDVPVCFRNQPCRMLGRGDVLTPISAFPKLSAVLVNPCVAVPADKTRQVFGYLAAEAIGAEDDERGVSVIAPVASSALEDWLALITAGRNDLEAPARRVVPAIGAVLAALNAHPLTVIARLSGAGPTCFALTRTDADAETVAQSVAALNPTWWVRATFIG